MDTYRAFLAIIISFIILIGYQYLFVGFDQPVAVDEQTEQSAPQQAVQSEEVAAGSVAAPTVTAQAMAPVKTVAYDRTPKEITVETDLYTATLSEDGGTVTSFILKNYKETHDAESLGMQLIKTDASQGFPLEFYWGSAVPGRILYDSNVDSVSLSKTQDKGQLVLRAEAENGLTVVRTYSFNNDTYLIDMNVKVINGSGSILQGTPQINQVNTRFETSISPAKRFLFAGPAAYINGELNEVKAGEFEEGPYVLQGSVDWVGYESNYFLCAVVPTEDSGKTFTMQGTDDLARTQLSGSLDTIQAGMEKEYNYHIFYGPKKLKMLKEIGYNLDRSINFGWFDVIAKPALWLLNTFHGVFHNYGIAIILVTVLFKACFWPISQKGMKSMKNMQKLQPKMAKLKEKYKNDPTKMNQEVMSLYKTYKVNPLGGCLPMVLQIPVFFALYKVLLLSIELRHAPFMLWITDLSAPDRLYIGFDLPYLGGLPVLTLLMGASMFFQQKLTPTTADPTQAKIMMFLPVVFTFMFLNFASGLVLYWFVNNLLSILQQVLINRDRKKPAVAS